MKKNFIWRNSKFRQSKLLFILMLLLSCTLPNGQWILFLNFYLLWNIVSYLWLWRWAIRQKSERMRILLVIISEWDENISSNFLQELIKIPSTKYQVPTGSPSRSKQLKYLVPADEIIALSRIYITSAEYLCPCFLENSNSWVRTTKFVFEMIESGHLGVVRD